jgi:copper chaperone NosL
MTPVSAMSRRRVIGVLLGAFAAVACKSSDAPTEPVWGKEPCAYCKMLVSDKRYAAQVIDDNGEHRFFDDIGCMVRWMDARRPPALAWVREPPSGAWLDARTARYVQGARTPMDFGFEARSGGELAFEAVRVAVREKNEKKRSGR